MPGPADPAVREAAEAVAILLSLVAPVHRRGDVGAARARAVRRAGRLARRSTRRCWSQESVTCVVQVAGKVRDRLEVSPDIAEDELRELALATPAAVAALGGTEPRTVIVRAPKLVNIVPG